MQHQKKTLSRSVDKSALAVGRLLVHFAGGSPTLRLDRHLCRNGSFATECRDQGILLTLWHLKPCSVGTAKDGGDSGPSRRLTVLYPYMRLA